MKVIPCSLGNTPAFFHKHIFYQNTLPFSSRNLYLMGYRQLLSLTILTALLFAIFRFNEFPVGGIGDDAEYIELARSLAEGKGYTLAFDPSPPSAYNGAFPMGYPLVLSLFAFLSPTSLTLLKIVSFFAIFGALALFYFTIRPHTSRHFAYIIIALSALNPWTIAYSNRALSEAVFMLFSFLAIYFFTRSTSSHKGISVNILAAALCIGFAAMTRTVGLSLLMASIAFLLARKRFLQTSVLSTIAILAMTPQILQNTRGHTHLISSSYHNQVLNHTQHLTDRLHFMWLNLLGYIDELAAVALPIFGNSPKILVENHGLSNLYETLVFLTGTLILIAVMTAALPAIVRRKPLPTYLALYTFFYAAALLNFSGSPSGIQLRLLVPLIPILYFFSAQGAITLVNCVKGPYLTSIILAAMVSACSIGHNIFRVAHPMVASREPHGRGFIDDSKGAAWVQAKIPEDAVIMTHRPLERHIHFHRSTVDFGHVPRLTPEQLVERIARYNVRFLFFAPSDPDQADTLTASENHTIELIQHDNRYSLVHREPAKQVFIYQFLPYSNNK